MHPPFKSAETLIRQSMKETGGEVCKISADLYIHYPCASASPKWREKIVEEQLEEIKFKEFPDSLMEIKDKKISKKIQGLVFDCLLLSFSEMYPGATSKINNNYHEIIYKTSDGRSEKILIRSRKFSVKHFFHDGIHFTNGRNSFELYTEWPKNIRSGNMLQAIYFLGHHVSAYMRLLELSC